MRVAGNQGQGPGHNEAIVGPQSVDFQAAVPHAPLSLLLPTSAPCREVTQTSCGFISLCAESGALDPTRGVGVRPPYAVYAPTTRWRQSTAVWTGGDRKEGDSCSNASGRGGLGLSCFIPEHPPTFPARAPRSHVCFLSPFTLKSQRSLISGAVGCSILTPSPSMKRKPRESPGSLLSQQEALTASLVQINPAD